MGRRVYWKEFQLWIQIESIKHAMVCFAYCHRIYIGEVIANLNKVCKFFIHDWSCDCSCQLKRVGALLPSSMAVNLDSLVARLEALSAPKASLFATYLGKAGGEF